jgi:hypothetical protein
LAAGALEGGEAFDDDCVFCDGEISFIVVITGFYHFVADVNQHEELQDEGSQSQGDLLAGYQGVKTGQLDEECAADGAFVLGSWHLFAVLAAVLHAVEQFDDVVAADLKEDEHEDVMQELEEQRVGIPQHLQLLNVLAHRYRLHLDWPETARAPLHLLHSLQKTAGPGRLSMGCRQIPVWVRGIQIYHQKTIISLKQHINRVIACLSGVK